MRDGPGPDQGCCEVAAIMRLAGFCLQHPAVTVCKPTPAHARWRAFIAEGTVPGDDRAMVVTDPDFTAFMTRLEGLFSRRRRPPRARPG